MPSRLKIAIAAFAATLGATLALAHTLTFVLAPYEPYSLSHWSVAPCILTAWLSSLLVYHLCGEVSLQEPEEAGRSGDLLSRVAYLPGCDAYDIFLDVLVLLSVADRRFEHERLAWTATIDEHWSRLYERTSLSSAVVVSIRAEIVRVNPDALLHRIENARGRLSDRDCQVLVRLVFLLFSNSGPMSLTAAEVFIDIATRLGIPFGYLTACAPSASGEPPHARRQILPSSTPWHAAA